MYADILWEYHDFSGLTDTHANGGGGIFQSRGVDIHVTALKPYKKVYTSIQKNPSMYM